jgi:glycosyltransferase involved in cell wall biosynthesis
VLINQSYRQQRITGQQRYATEITRRLKCRPDFAEIGPSRFWSHSSLRVWAWLQLVLPLTAARAIVLSMTSRAPLWHRRHVLVVHDLFVLTNPEWFSRRYVWTHAPLLRAQLRRAAAVVAVSEPVAKQVAPLCHGTIVVAPNAASAVFEQDRSDLAADLAAVRTRGLEPGRYFLTVGSQDPRKNLALLAQAYGLLTDDERGRHPLAVVGGGSAVFRTEQIGWPVGTVNAGYVDDDELRQLYRGARAVVFVSRAEGFGLPLVEAAAAGARRFVVSDISVFRWICGDGASYVDPASASSIAAGLRASLRRSTEQEIDLDRFSWDASARIIGDVCGEVARAK